MNYHYEFDFPNNSPISFGNDGGLSPISFGNGGDFSPIPFGNSEDLSPIPFGNGGGLSPISFEMDSDADDDFDSVIEDFMNLPDLELPPDSPRSILHVPQPVEDIFDIFLNGP